MAVRILNARAWNITVNDEDVDLKLNIGASAYTGYLTKDRLEKISKSTQISNLVDASDISFDLNNATVEELGILASLNVALTASVYVVASVLPTYAPIGALCLKLDTHKVYMNDPAGVIYTINATPTAGGVNYLVGDILDVVEVGGVGGRVTVSTINATTGAVTAIALYQGGQGYTVAAGKATTGGSGSGCTVEVTSVSVGSGWTILN